MKTKYTFEMMELDEDLVAVPIASTTGDFRGVLKINETAAAILKLLEEDTTEEKIVNALLDEYSGDKKEISFYVHEYIMKLIEEGIVE